ncbi:MAG: hypothetical protein GY760_10600 [Deltaproteobacteria bacterium]|nr:hypothetical protein [Deltaproteobacteria bacterium]
MIEITDEQAKEIIEKKEIQNEIISSGEKVAVIFTQDWCPQWKHMATWLDSTEDKDMKTFYLAYNNKSYYEEFMDFKESVLLNDLVPYVRYYLNGKFVCDSNFVSEELFLSNFG